MNCLDESNPLTQPDRGGRTVIHGCPDDAPPFGVPLRCIRNRIEGGAFYWEVTLQTEDNISHVLRLRNPLLLGRWLVRVRGDDPSHLTLMGDCGMRAAGVGYGYEVDLRFSTTQVRLYDADTPQQLRAQLGDSIIWASRS